MANIWFTADTHFNHEFACRLRGVHKCIDEMNEDIVDRWNDSVSQRDTVYHLGDFAFGNAKSVSKIRSRLHGKVHIVLGNHDYKNRIHKLPHLFSSVHDLLTIKVNKKKITLCHYAMRVWNSSHYNSWHLYGHSHGMLHGIGKCFDVGFDAIEGLISFDTVSEIMEDLPDNFNLVAKNGEQVV